MEKNVLLEVGCEEMPARFMPGFLADLKRQAQKKLEEARLTFSKIETYGTYRRLVLYIENISSRQPDITLEVQGPSVEIAYKDGAPTGAAFGFAKKQVIDVNDLKTKEVNGKKHICAVVNKKGESTADLLPKLLPEIITSLYMPISMRWGNLDFKFIRPIHWILALYGSKVIKFELAGIKSSSTTYGSSNIDEFKSLLLKAGVIVDQNERREKIVAEAKKVNPNVLIDRGLLEEVNYLVENPVAVQGSFKPAFLNLPSEVLITSMKKNQKYFPVVEDKKLQPHFIIITDGSPKACHSHIREGNQRVISARLSDAKFFHDEDLKIPLKKRVDALKKVEFFKGLGTVYEKMERVKGLSHYIGKHLMLDEAKIAKISRAALLCKADLTTQMVFEFPELQGIVGREYALAEGEDPEVASAIFEHYLPRFAGDILPKSEAGTILSLADKFDTIVGCFSIGTIPTGSEDPYGLRRQAHGIVKIILDKRLDILLDEVILASFKLFRKEPKELAKITQFLALRLKPIMEEAGVRYDVCDAVLANFNDIIDAYQKAMLIMKLLKEEWFRGIVVTADRVGRIAKGTTREEIKEHDLVDETEKALYSLYQNVNFISQEKIDKGEFMEALQELAKLTAPTHEFFEKVLVMHQDERIKTNRLALLKSIHNTFLNFADFSRIVL